MTRWILLPFAPKTHQWWVMYKNKKSVSHFQDSRIEDNYLHEHESSQVNDKHGWSHTPGWFQIKKAGGGWGVQLLQDKSDPKCSFKEWAQDLCLKPKAWSRATDTRKEADEKCCLMLPEAFMATEAKTQTHLANGNNGVAQGLNNWV